MGHRSNVVVKKGDVTTIYHEQWGALGLLSTVLKGPEYVPKWVSYGYAVETMQDNVFCEALAVIDFDAQHLLVYGGLCIKYFPAVRLEYLRMARAVWPGWSVAWARRTVLDAAEYIGMPSGRLDEKPLVRPSDADLDKIDVHTGRAIVTLVSDDRVEDYKFDPEAGQLVIVGPSLLDALGRRTPGVMPREDSTGGGVLLDTRTKRMSWWTSLNHYPANEDVAHAWPGWSIEWLTRCLPEQAEASGRNPVDYALTVEEVTNWLAADLFHESGKPREFGVERLHKWRSGAGLPPIVNGHLITSATGS